MCSFGKLSFITIFLFIIFSNIQAQTYFPPLSGNQWDTLSPSELNWCPEKIDSLLSFLESRNSKSFMVLVDGRVVLESYFNGHNANAFWYWASAGKTLIATLIGIAQEEGSLDITDPVSQYLGEGWTNCNVNNEMQRTIWHQLTMTSTFNNSPLYLDCEFPICFQCAGEAGSEWHYHNTVYRKLHDVLQEATGTSVNLYTLSKIMNKIGMFGFWAEDDLFLSNTRDMARFGLLALNDFVWDGDVVLGDQEYIAAMTTPSQNLNLSYGYLWWLNGQESHYLPVNPILYEGSLIPTAPADMYAGLGADDQKVYVIPSKNMVVVRMGESAYEEAMASSLFDTQLWALMEDLECETTNTESFSPANESLNIFPNPSNDLMFFNSPVLYGSAVVLDLSGKTIHQLRKSEIEDGFSLPAGMYLVKAQTIQGELQWSRAVFY